VEALRNVARQSTFDLIKRYAAERHSLQGEHKARGRVKLIRAVENFNETKLRAYFNKMRQWRDRCNTRDKQLRTALANMSVSHLRSCFFNWKDKTAQVSVHAQHEEEDGPTNLEAWQLRQDNFNLIRLLREDGLTNKEINRGHQQSEMQYRTAVERSLCRILCKQTEGLELLPICLNQWKRYARVRKIWRRVLKDTEIRLLNGGEMSAKLWAFRRLQYSHEDRQKVLWGRPIAQLRTQCVKNVEQLDRLADLVEDREGSMRGLKD